MTQIHKLMKWIFVFLLVSFAYAIPVPHGIDGHIYELDGITPVNADFWVRDLSNNQSVQGKTRSGYYSVSLDGSDGDIILITTWNTYHSSNRSVILKGVMHGVDLLLNTSIPPIQPVISSEPKLKGTVNSVYQYRVIAYDENNDSLYYGLDGPENMTISTSGLLEWIPKNVGVFGVKIGVSDGIFYTNQSYNISVGPELVINHAPNITSIPILNARVLRLYRYVIKAEDHDEDKLLYRLIQSPNNMVILKNGIILWVPFPKHVGNNSVEIEVSDGDLSDYQSFNIKVEPFVRPRFPGIFRGGSGVGGGGIYTTDNGSAIESKNEEIEEFDIRPSEIKVIEKNVYKYLYVESEKEFLMFTVERGWVGNRKSDEVVINYLADDWIELPTEIIEVFEDKIVYRASYASKGYYAISLKNVRVPIGLIVTGPDEPHVLAGKIFKDRSKQVKAGTRIRVRNLKTKEEFLSETGIGQDSGGFYMLVYGDNGDELEIKAEKLFAPRKTIELKGDMRNIDIYPESKITGAVISVPAISKYGDLAVTIILLFTSLYWRFHTVKKRRLNE